MILPTAVLLVMVLSCHSAAAELSDQASAFSAALANEVKSKNLVSMFEFADLPTKQHAALFKKNLKTYLPKFGIHVKERVLDTLYKDVIKLAPHLTPDKFAELFGNTFGVILDHFGLIPGDKEIRHLARLYANTLDFFRISKVVEGDLTTKLEEVAEAFRFFLFSLDVFDNNTFLFDILTYRDQAYAVAGLPEPK